MAGAQSRSSLQRFFLCLVAAVPVAAVVVALTTALDAGPTPKVAFDVKIAGEDVRASGTLYLRSDRFSYEGNRLSFTGTVSGDDVKIAGKVTTGERLQTRDFSTSGRLSNNRMSASLNGDRGSRIGTLKLEFLNR